jgi:DNA polymerase III epsilon subunit-like protein
MYLFIDTETTGLPHYGRWPHMVQLAWLVYDDDGEELAAQSHIISPNGFKIPKEAEMIHGISTEKAIREGIPLELALSKFSHFAERQKFIVGHNLDFDVCVIQAECSRIKFPMILPPIEMCTMRSKDIVQFCQLPKPKGKGYKWPKLCELHQQVFGEGFEGGHDALKDAAMCAKCFFKLREMGVIK